MRLLRQLAEFLWLKSFKIECITILNFEFFMSVHFKTFQTMQLDHGFGTSELSSKRMHS